MSQASLKTTFTNPIKIPMHIPRMTNAVALLLMPEELEAMRRKIGSKRIPPSKPPIAAADQAVAELGRRALVKPFDDADAGPHHHPADRAKVARQKRNQDVAEQTADGAADSTGEQAWHRSLQLLRQPGIGHAGDQVQTHSNCAPHQRQVSATLR